LKKLFIPLALSLALILAAFADAAAAFHLLQTFVMPDVPKGPYCDHLAIDLAGSRLFTTPQAEKSVEVLDFKTGRLIHRIPELENPHSILYRPDVNRLYITDGGAGKLRIYDSTTYEPVKTIDGLPDADSIGYDSSTKELFVTNGGESIHSAFSSLSVIDTTGGTKLGDVKIQAGALEAMVLEKHGPLIYINMMDQNKIAVVNRQTRKLVATWPVTAGRKNIAIALDEVRHRLFVGCRNTETSGVIVIFDTQTGKELGTTLPIAGWVDYLAYDPPAKHLYATCGPQTGESGYVYAFADDGHSGYSLLAKQPTALRAKTGLYVPELKAMIVAVPHFEGPARILEFRTP
jgi:DNA-binding beta-propeller fold protein YncE